MDLNLFYKYKQEDFLKIVEWLNQVILPKAIKNINKNDFCLMNAKLLSEKLPTNQRNLTDARTRIGTLLEYCLAVEFNTILKEEGLVDFTTGFMLANRYPDLVVRDADFNPQLRLEVKTIEAISEEKSANFDIGIRSIDKNSDVVCILLWEWETIEELGIEYPMIHKCLAVDAYTLAQCRDVNWLSKSEGENHKLIDISGVYVPNDGMFKEEEKNLGKLLRIDTDLSKCGYIKDNGTTALYDKFKKEVILFGLQQIVKRTIGKISISPKDIVEYYSVTDYTQPMNILADYKSKEKDYQLIIVGGVCRSKKGLEDLIVKHLSSNKSSIGNTQVLMYTEKFAWKLYTFDMITKKVNQDDSGKKPELIFEKMTSI